MQRKWVGGGLGGLGGIVLSLLRSWALFLFLFLVVKLEFFSLVFICFFIVLFVWIGWCWVGCRFGDKAERE